MKKIITAALVLSMAAALSGCGNKESSDASSKTTGENYFDTLTEEYGDHEDDEHKTIYLVDYVTVTFNGWNGEYDNDAEFTMDYEKLANDINIDGITPEFLSKCYSASSRTQYFSTNGNEFEFGVNDITNYTDLSDHVEELKKLRELEIRSSKTKTITVEGLKDKVYLTKADNSTDMSSVDEMLDAEAEKNVTGVGTSGGTPTNDPLGNKSSVNYKELFNISGNMFDHQLQITNCEKVGSYFAVKSTADPQYKDDTEFTPNLYINLYKATPHSCQKQENVV